MLFTEAVVNNLFAAAGKSVRRNALAGRGPRVRFTAFDHFFAKPIGLTTNSV
jgi:hypothetical protein